MSPVFANKMILQGLLVVSVMVANLGAMVGAVSDRVFDAQPKIITQDGHLIFMTADNHNITFKSLGQGSIRINDDDLKAVVASAKSSISDMERIKTNDIAVMQQTIQQVLSRLDTLHSTQSRLNTVEETVRLFQNQFISGANGTSLADLSSGMTRLTQQVGRLRNEFRQVKRLLETDECTSNPCENGGTCVDAYNGFTCRCPPNWQGTTCESDVNECREFYGTASGCQNGATCLNTPGGYTCECSPNMYGIHCTETHDDCSRASNMELCAHGTCVNQQRGQSGQAAFTCICEQGWTSNGHNPACNVDVNECETGQHSCSKNPPVQCINIPGRFMCAPCPAGYSGDGFSCVDIDECQLYNGGCSRSPFVQCVNTPGSRQCGPCPGGYQGDGITCSFIGHCTMNNGGCHPLATCMENLAISSSYVQCRCPPGHQGSGFGITGCVPQSGGGTDVMTPLPYSPCDTNPCLRGTCVASGPYAFRCNCPIGYEGQRCELNTNDCISEPCLNGATCSDQPIGYTCHCSPHHTGANCEEEIDACGDYLYDANGTIRYPSNPSIVYQNDKSCAWVITTTDGMVLNLTFPQFHLESSHDCEFDFLQLNDGQSAGSHLIGRFCGSSPPNHGNVITTHNAVYIWFHSDSTVATDGFSIKWETIEHVCGGDLSGAAHGSVVSPGYPGQYPMNRDCVWTIRVPLGKRIIISFATLMLEHHEDCNYDFLEIRDGLREVDPVLGTYCGTDPTTPPPIQTSGSFARVYFHSDSSRTANGFHLTYSSVPSVHGCGGLLSTESGAFSSPDHPNAYSTGLECDWEIRVPVNERIRLTFTTFELERHDRCHFDYVEIFDGRDETAPLIGRYCGSNLPPVRLSTTNNLFIKFRSDTSVNHLGFRATYIVGGHHVATHPELTAFVCGGTFTEPNGIIHSPYYPEAYPGMRECIYVIRQPPGKAIQLTFLAFDVESSGNCRYDYLLVRDGESETAPLQGKYCGTVIPDTIISTYNALWMQFQTDNSIHNRGFLVNYTTIDLDCGGILNDLSGVITSPSHPEHYLHGANCRWIIRPPSGYVVRLTFVTFAVELHQNCIFDYVAIYDNTTTESASKLAGRYCGNTLPPVITSMDNLMLVVFHSDSSVALDGFSIHYVAFDASSLCGGEYYTPVGIIRSPNFPNGYQHNRHCTWKIELPFGKQILLNITRFELESHDRCDFDYLEIRNGGYLNSPLIGKYCGGDVPRIIPSHGNKMMLKFVSDSSFTAAGFEISWDGTTTGCGGELSASQGSIQSPNYPDSCNGRIICTWRITVARGSKIKMHFSDLALPTSENCQFGDLEIYNGISASNPLLRRICGSTPPNAFISDTHEVFLRYRCNEYGTTNNHRFHLIYDTVCNVELRGRRGVIETPNYPNPYPHERNCTWRIQGPTGNSLNMSFSMLQLERSRNCEFDSISITNIMDRSILGPYCEADRVPRRLSIDSNIVAIKFVSDSSYANNGFALEWVSSGCGGDFRKLSGTFSSPNYPARYPDQLTCDWEIIAPPGNNIELTIHDYDIESSRNCIFDALTIYGGIGISSPVLTAICHRQTEPVHISSSGNHMYVSFKSDHNRAYRGFNASYVIKTDGCGGIFTVNSGSIHSRNYPSHYAPRDDCSWLVTVSKGHTVELNFLDFEVLPVFNGITGNCEGPNVAVYDGPNELSPLLVRHCGYQLPAPSELKSSNNQMFIKLQADESITAKGFMAKYTTGCGAVLYADEPGSIGFTEVSGLNLRNSNCTWIIKARNLEDKVTLIFTTLDVSRPPDNCTQRSLLDIYDGELSDSPVLLSLCSGHIPPAVTSLGSVIRVVTHSQFRNFLFSATYYEASAGCGGVFDSFSGTFVSPDYPNFYPAESECVWTIKTAPGHTAMLSFSEFDMEESDFCNQDYVEVREKDDSGRLMGRFCGQALPANLTAAHQLWVKFRSDGQNGRQGFVASYSLLYKSYPTGTSGEIASPLYPRMFKGGGIFEWTITVPLHMIVQATLLELNILNGGNWRRRRNQVYLKFYDGIDDTGDLLSTFSGHETLDPVVSNGNQMFVKFSAGFGVPLRGSVFFLKWNATYDGPIDPNWPLPINRSSDCDAVHNIDHHDQLILSSPGYPNGYAINKHCEWLILTPIGTRPSFYFTHLDLEGRYHCYSDYVEFFGGTSVPGQWDSLGRFCSRENGNSAIISGANSMKVIFSSDYSRNGTGFSGRFIPVCGGNITARSGFIQTPNYPQNYDDNDVCEWLISVRPGRTIHLHFDDFKLEGDPPICRSDYLILRNGLSGDSPLLGFGKYCGTSIPHPLDTTSNHLSIRFVSSPSISYKGFKLIYNEVSAECGGIRMLSVGGPLERIETPNYPLPYPMQTECEWTIVAPALSRVRLDFESPFDIPVGPDCLHDYLLVYDGGTTHAPVLGRFCNHNVPPTVQASGNSLFLQFSSVDSHPSTGFTATARIAFCGGTISGNASSISSPNYPHGYLNGIDCEWTIRALTGHYLVFTMIDIQTWTEPTLQQPNCSQSDSVLVRDSNSTGMLLGEFCGEQLPAPFSSAGDVAYVRFRSHRNSPMRGFRLIFNMSVEECGGERTTQTGVISSPNYPGFYPNHRTCTWVIRAPRDRRVRLTFTHKDLHEDDRGRCNDFVVGYNFAKFERDFTILHPYYICGSGGELPVVISSSNYMKVIFTSDGQVSATGFRAVYDMELERECGGDLLLPGGNIVSPGFEMGNYSHNLYCEWNLVSERPNSTFLLTLNHMVLERANTMGQSDVVCAYDRLDIFAASDVESGAAFSTLCGNLSETKFAVPFSSLVFVFKTDASISFTGFNLSYSLNDCGGELTEAGSITSPGYPTSYANNLHCAWAIRFEEGQQVLITFEGFELQSSEGCAADKIIVRNGMSRSSPIIGTYCGHDLTREVQSQRHEIYIEFISDAANTDRGFLLRATPVTSGCGGFFHGTDGVITSIGYPNNYPPNVECSWIFEGQLGFHYNVSFVGRFDLEMTASCDKDFVEGFDYVGERWVSLGRRCGRDVQRPFVSKSPKLGIMFRTNDAIDGGGFKAIWSETCGGQFTDTSGTFSSPGYPEVYPNLLDCVYVISPDISHYVVLTFDDDFDLEASGSMECNYDVLEIFAGNDTNGILLNKVCGSTRPEEISVLGAITVRLRTDHSEQRKGFLARYQVSECGGIFNHSSEAAATGVVMSPTHLGSYHANMNCTWIIEAVPNRVIAFKFQKMDVEHSYDFENCEFDHVSFYDGGSTLSPLLGSFCGFVIPEHVISTGNILTIRFITDEVTEESGFKGIYRTTYGAHQGCGGVLNETHGTVQSLDFDNDGKYEPGLECQWTIIGAPYKVLQLTFQRFDIEKPADRDSCPWDFLEIRDGPSADSVLIDKLCGNQMPYTVVSSTNQLWLMFSSDDDVNKAGFQAIYTSMEPTCGGFLNVTNVTNFIQSPGFPENYPPNTRCRWWLYSSSENRPMVEFSFGEFQLEDSYRCTKDYLSFHQGWSDEYPTDTVTHCGHAKPADLYFYMYHDIYVQFASDSSTQNKGFQIYYRYASCNRTYEAPYGDINRLSHHLSQQEPLDCYIRISVPANRTITLSFYTFVLDYQNFGNCQAFLEIRDGSTETAPLLAKLCGTHDIPNPVSSSGNEMWLRLYTSSIRDYYQVKAQYYSTDKGPGCGGEIVSASGSFASPGFPGNYSLNAICRWTVTVPYSHQVQIHFTSFDIRSSDNCTDSSLEFYDGDIENENYLAGSFCGTDYPGTVRIQSNKFIVKYITSPRNTGTGFRIAFVSYEGRQDEVVVDEIVRKTQT